MPKVSTPSKAVATRENKPEINLTDNMKEDVTKFLGMNPKNMTIQENKNACTAILTNAMYGIGLKPDDYPAFFKAAVDKAVSTKMLLATSWSSWSGYKDFNVKMSLVDTYTRQYERYHSPTATQVLISLALLRIKAVTTKGSTDLHENIRKFRVYEHLPTAIHHWNEFQNRIICFDVVYVKTKEDKEKDEIDRQRQNRDNQQTEDVTMMDTSELDLAASPTLALKRFNERNWAMVAHDLKVLGEKSPLDISKDMACYVKEETIETNREEVEQYFTEELQALAENENPNRERLAKITLPQLKVLNRTAKTLIHHWAAKEQLSNITAWKEEVKPDLTQLTTVNSMDVDIPEMTSSYPAADIWREMLSHAEDTGCDEWTRDLARIKTIMDDNERHNGNQTSERDIDNIAAKMDQIFDMIKRDININDTIHASQVALAAKVDNVVDVTTTLGKGIDKTIEATEARLGQTLNVAHRDLADKMGELMKVTEADRTALDQCIQSTRENLISIDLSLERLEAEDTDLTQIITEAQNALIASRQAVIRGNAIMNDLVIRLERQEEDRLYNIQQEQDQWME